MFVKSVLSLLALCSVAFAAQSPVLVIGGTGESLPALSLVNSEKFLALTSAQDAMTVVFAEKTGKPEDFLGCVTESGETCFSGLKTVQEKAYYRHVENPIDTIKAKSGNCQVLSTDNNGQLVAPIEFVPNSCVIVNLFGSVQAHDALITKFIQDNKSNKVVAVYTPNDVVSRKTRSIPKDTALFSDNPGFVIYYGSAQLCNLGADKKTTCQPIVPIGQSTLGTDNVTTNSFDVKIASGSDALTFNIVQSQGYFELQNLKYGGNTFRVYPAVQSLTTFSYFCGNKTFYQYGAETNTLSLVFEMLQFQAPFLTTPIAADTFSFGDPWHCVPFVSIPILAGLFVCAILLAILGVGICWLMDINTMDRFDDPKGKTITINANE